MTTDEPAETPRQRLARLMNARRADLDMTWKDVAEKGGLTTETLRQVRFGDSDIRELTKRGIERALRWAGGSVDAILHGDNPVPNPWKPVDTVVRTVLIEGPTDLAFVDTILNSGLRAGDQAKLLRWVSERRREQHVALMSELEALLRAYHDDAADPDDAPPRPARPRRPEDSGQRIPGAPHAGTHPDDGGIPYTHLAN